LPETPMDKSGKSALSNMMWVSTLGIHLVLTTVVGFVIGYYADKWFETAPLFIIIFVILGIASGFRQILKEIRHLNEQDIPKDPSNN